MSEYGHVPGVNNDQKLNLLTNQGLNQGLQRSDARTYHKASHNKDNAEVIALAIWQNTHEAHLKVEHARNPLGQLGARAVQRNASASAAPSCPAFDSIVWGNTPAKTRTLCRIS
eukprot:515398-Amphidinium_carterae.1